MKLLWSSAAVTLECGFTCETSYDFPRWRREHLPGEKKSHRFQDSLKGSGQEQTNFILVCSSARNVPHLALFTHETCPHWMGKQQAQPSHIGNAHKFLQTSTKKVACVISFHMIPKENEMYTKTSINSIGSGGIDVSADRKGSR